MTMKALLKTTGLSALAVSLAIAALPTAASAADGRRGSWESRSGEARAQRPESSRPAPAQRESRSEPSFRAPARQVADRQPASTPSPRFEQRTQRSAAPAATAPTPPVRSSGWGAGGDRSAQRSDGRTQGRSDGWRSGGGDRDRTAQRSDSRTADRSQSRSDGPSWRGDSRGDRGSTYTDRTRSGTYTDRDRRQTYRDGYRDGRQADTRSDRRDRRDSYRDGYRDGRRADYRSGDYNRWDRRWRDNHRYDWNDYRRSNRSVYRIGRYYAPYRNYYYSRIGIGFYLDSLFYTNRYWIADPWYYRLPPVYGPYRWVRYYDDVMLVNIYTGEVVDVIYDFFW